MPDPLLDAKDAFLELSMYHPQALGKGSLFWVPSCSSSHRAKGPWHVHTQSLHNPLRSPF